MNLFESDWFFHMVENQGKTPQERLIAVFTVTSQWLSAPGMRENFARSTLYPSTPQLRSYLTETAAAAGITEPAALTAQLLILLQGALAEELRDSSVNAVENALCAAHAVIGKACRPGRRLQMVRWSAMACAFFALGIGLSWLMLPAVPASSPSVTRAVAVPGTYIRANNTTLPENAGQDETEAVLHLQEQIERGHCPAPQLLGLPQGQVTAYMNVIHFRTPENPDADRQNLHSFLVWFKQARASECYYPPVNGHTLVRWSS